MYPNFTSRMVKTASLMLMMAAAGCATTKVTKDEQAALEKVEIPAAVVSQYDEALNALQAGETDTAVALLEAFVQSQPGYASAYINLATLYTGQQRDDEAVAMLSRALEIDASNPAALNLLGMIKRRAGDFAGAEKAWLGAIEANPDYAYAWYNLGVLYDLYLQDLQAALEHYQAYQRLSGSDAQDAAVARWIADLESRIGAQPQTALAR